MEVYHIWEYMYGVLHIWKAQGQGQIVQAVTSLRAPCLCSTARCWRRARARWCGRHTQRQSASVPVFCLRRGAEALTRYAAQTWVAHAALAEALAVGQSDKGRGSKQKMGAGWQAGQQARAARAAGKPAPEAARNCRTVVSCACRVFLTRLTVSAPPRAFLASSVLSVHA